jgi:hypothetical protein
MGRISKLENEVDLDIVPNHQHPSSSPSSLSGYGGSVYDSYDKELFFGRSILFIVF